MKYLDKLLKVLKTDRNTFFTYILTLATIYIVVDRVIEMLFMIFTGISVSYWGPIGYTFALACPVFAFLFSGSSKYGQGGDMKIMIVYMYAISLYIIAISMISQWINMLGNKASFSSSCNLYTTYNFLLSILVDICWCRRYKTFKRIYLGLCRHKFIFKTS